MKSFLKRLIFTTTVALAFTATPMFAQNNAPAIARHDGKAADMTKPVQVLYYSASRIWSALAK
ncbi:MAG: hypothetical protein FJ405_08635 [Verrucomicrobia bacterium]|nr:hypothetical protein [Verrucomicrobiota bacterium]